MTNQTATTEPKSPTEAGGQVERVVRRGQLIRLKNYGLVRFDRLDFYMGECTAQLTGIDYPGTYNPFPEKLEQEGFTIVDA